MTARLQGDAADGARFVPLAPITEPKPVVSRIAQALGVRETGGLAQPLEEAIASATDKGS